MQVEYSLSKHDHNKEWTCKAQFLVEGRRCHLEMQGPSRRKVIKDCVNEVAKCLVRHLTVDE